MYIESGRCGCRPPVFAWREGVASPAGKPPGEAPRPIYICGGSVALILPVKKNKNLRAAGNWGLDWGPRSMVTLTGRSDQWQCLKCRRLGQGQAKYGQNVRYSISITGKMTGKSYAPTEMIIRGLPGWLAWWFAGG